MTEVYVYGDIGADGDVRAKDFVPMLAEAAARSNVVLVRIHSYGGDPFEALAMLAAIEDCRAVVNTIIDGVAASAGTILVMGGQKRMINKHGRIMTHQASSFAAGSAGDMRRAAELVDQVNEQMVTLYADKTGKQKDYVLANWMKVGEDCWFNATQAVEQGLVHEVAPSMVQGVSAKSFIKIAAHFDTALEEVTEQLFKNTNTNPMNLKALAAALIAIKLNGEPLVTLAADSATEAEIINGINAVSTRINTLAGQVVTLQADKLKLEAEKKALETSVADQKAMNLVELALSQKKITAGEKDNYVKLAKADYATTESLLNAKVPFKSPSETIDPATGDTYADPLLKLTWDEAHKKPGALEQIKAKYPDHFDKIKKEKFNK